MFARIGRIFRALFGWMLRSAENPELILQQYMDDLRDKMPKLNAQVRDMVAIEKQVEIQTERLRQTVIDLQPKCEMAVKIATADESKKAGAMTLLNTLNTTKTELASAEEQLVRLKAQSATALANRTAYEQRINEKINEAKMQIGRSKRAEIETQMSSLMVSMQTGDESDTLNRMTEKIDEKEAKAKASTEVAGTTVEAQLLDIEKASTASKSEGMFAEMQRQLGLVPDVVAPAKTMDCIPVAAVTETATAAPKAIEGTN